MSQGNLTIGKPRPVSQVLRETPLEDIFVRFLRLDAAGGDPAPDTVRGYLAAARCWFAWTADRGVNPRTATEGDVRAYRRALVEAGYSRGTVAHRLAVVRRLYAALAWSGFRHDNPAAGIRAPRGRYAPEERIRFVEESRLAILFHGIPANTVLGLRDRGMLALMVLHGLRGARRTGNPPHDREVVLYEFAGSLTERGRSSGGRGSTCLI